MDYQRLTFEQKQTFEDAIIIFNPVDVVPFRKEGATVGSGLEVYNPNVMYIGFDILMYNTSTIASTSTAYCDLFDSGNAFQGRFINNAPYWDTVATVQKYIRQQVSVKNVIFSRLIGSQLDHLRFIGFKITFP